MGQFIRKADDLAAIVQALRSDGKKVVYTSGIFDLVHAGQLRALVDAKSRGDYLVVGIHPDDACEGLDHGRPFVSQQDRIDFVCGLLPVDYVVMADSDPAEGTVATLGPDLLAVGVDPSLPPGDEKKAIRTVGGRSFTANAKKGLSVAKLRERIVELSNAGEKATAPKRKTRTAAKSASDAGEKATSKSRATKKKSTKKAKSTKAAAAKAASSKAASSKAAGKASTKSASRKAAAKKSGTAKKSSAVRGKVATKKSAAKTTRVPARKKKRTAKKPELVGAS